MLFVTFDIEIVFLYPWAVHFDSLGLFGLAAMGLFIVNVSVADHRPMATRRSRLELKLSEHRNSTHESDKTGHTAAVTTEKSRIWVSKKSSPADFY